MAVDNSDKRVTLSYIQNISLLACLHHTTFENIVNCWIISISLIKIFHNFVSMFLKSPPPPDVLYVGNGLRTLTVRCIFPYHDPFEDTGFKDKLIKLD